MLSAKKQKVLEHLLISSSHKEAAEQAGVSIATLYRYKQDFDFQIAYKERRKELFESVTNKLQSSSFQAIETLNEVMKNPNTAAMARVTAASKVLDLTYQSLERDVLEKEIEELKEVILSILEEKQ